jgi:hypothetical protein
VAAWSLLFSPVFGGWLLAANWRAMDEPARALHARRWARIAFTMLVLGLLDAYVQPKPAAITHGVEALAVAFVITWYFVSAREQVRAVSARWGDAYPRRGWAVPLACAVPAWFAYFAAMLALTVAGYAAG